MCHGLPWRAHEPQHALIQALSLETSELLFDAVRATFTGLDRARSATPRDEGDADPQGESVNKPHSSDLLERGLGWMIVAAFLGRQRCMHGSSLIYSSRQARR